MEAFLKERRAWCLDREKVEGGRWNLTTHTSLNGSAGPGPGEEEWKPTSTSINGLCARLDINFSKTWYLFKPQWASIDTGEWSKGEYALCHRTVGLYLMVDWEQISSALRSWQSASFSQGILFSPCMSPLFLPLLSFPDASLCVLFFSSVAVIRSWILGTC